MEKRLWVVEFRPGRDLVSEPRFWPDFEAGGIIMQKTLEPIIWKTFRPASFPCMICGENEAEWFYKYGPWTLPVCAKCAEKEWEEIREVLRDRKEG